MTRRIAYNPNQILPEGTLIVTRVPIAEIGRNRRRSAGAVGEIVKSPLDHTHSYSVRFADGVEVALRRSQFAVFKESLRDMIWSAADALDDFDLMDHVVFRCVVGSRAYGLAQDTSDTDRRGIYLPPARMHWSLYGVPEQLENPETEECYWELQKFLTLALKANPNVLECLYTPLVEHVAPPARELIDMRAAFLSKLIHQTYNGYVLSQFKKIAAGIRNRRQIKWKHAMHLVRLLLAGITALREAYVPVAVDEHRDRLLAIRRGEVPWNEVDAWRLELHRRFDEAYDRTALPDRPDYQRANALLIRARHMALDRTVGDSAPCIVAAEIAPAKAAPDMPAGAIDEAALPFLREAVAGYEYPLLFVTISGAHLYGFPSADSDYDLRGVHVLPLRHMLGLDVRDETMERSSASKGVELDLVTHDATKFFRMLLKKNGYVLEQVFSPLVLHTTPKHEVLKEIARGCLTRHHAHHYLGFSRTQWTLFDKDRRLKPLLYVYRVLLTGIHLMRSGEVEANLERLNQRFRLSYIDDLIARKRGGAESQAIDDIAFEFHEREFQRLSAELKTAHAESRLPEKPARRDSLNDLLVRLRLRDGTISRHDAPAP